VVRETLDLYFTHRDDTRFTYAAATVRALERTLLPRKTLEAMATASSPREALEELAETSYARFMDPGQTPRAIGVVLDRVLADTYRLFSTVNVDPGLEAAVLRVHDFHNLKALLKSRFAGREPTGVVEYGLVDPALLGRALESGNYHDVPPDLARMAAEAAKQFELDADPRRLEILVDGAAIASRIAPLSRADSPALRRYARDLADVANMRLIIRLCRSEPDASLLEAAYTEGGTVELAALRRFLGRPPQALVEELPAVDIAAAVREGIDYLEEHDSYGALDREFETFLAEALREAHFEAFGPGPVTAYTLAREQETHLVRIVMVGKTNDVDPEQLIARIPMLYV
jgi:V/A-type H+-transporting ATPase subunit C